MKIIYCILIALLFNSCATIVHGAKQEISVRANTDSVEVIHQNTILGETPLTLNLNRSLDPATLWFRKKGFKPQKLELYHQTSSTIVYNILLGGLAPLGLIYDYSMGGFYEYSKSNHYISMEEDSINSYENFDYTDAPVLRKVFSGPTFGAVVFSDRLQHYFNETFALNFNRFSLSFGWLFEHTFQTENPNYEFFIQTHPEIYGTEQNETLFSMSGLLGIRAKESFEFAIGPEWFVYFTSLNISAGKTFNFNDIRVPIKFSITPSEFGNKFSLSSGFQW